MIFCQWPGFSIFGRLHFLLFPVFDGVMVCTNMSVSVSEVVDLPGPLNLVFYFFMVLGMEPEAHRLCMEGF